MKLSPALSLILNALLLSRVLWLALAEPRAGTRTRISDSVTNRIPSVQRQPVPPAAGQPLPQVVQVNEPFHWAQIESTDYRVYLANLRAIGCPESTVRDILVADLNDLFGGRVRTLLDEVNSQFWTLITSKQLLEQAAENLEKPFEALKKERDGVFEALFADSNPWAAERGRESAAAQRMESERLADFLPAEKRARFVAAREECERAAAALGGTRDLASAQRQARQKELDAAHDQALREWLTPEEFQELRLRESPAARVRDRLVSLDLSERDVRALANINLAKDEAQAALSQPDAARASGVAQLQQQAEAQTRELLGEERFAAWQREADTRYEPIYRVTQRLELPDATAAQAYDIRRQAEDAARGLRENKSLSAAARQAMLQAIGAETQQNLAAALGPTGFAAYDKIDGTWLTQLTSPSP